MRVDEECVGEKGWNKQRDEVDDYMGVKTG